MYFFQTFVMSVRLCHKLNDLFRPKKKKMPDGNRVLVCYLCSARTKVWDVVNFPRLETGINIILGKAIRLSLP